MMLLPGAFRVTAPDPGSDVRIEAGGRPSMHDPRVPETLEGWWLLHQMFRVRWPDWQTLTDTDRQAIACNAGEALTAMQPTGEHAHGGSTATCTLLGHKGDLMLIHFRPTIEDLEAAQLAIARLPLAAYLETTTSYVSVV